MARENKEVQAARLAFEEWAEAIIKAWIAGKSDDAMSMESMRVTFNRLRAAQGLPTIDRPPLERR